MARLLVARGAKLNVRADSGRCDLGSCWSTPLLGSFDRPEMWFDTPGRPAFDLDTVTALEERNDSLVAFLLRSGADANMPGSQGESPLHRAMRMGRAGIVRLLIAHGAKIEHRDQWQYTPLNQLNGCPHPSSGTIKTSAFRQPRCAEAVQLLIAAGAELNTRSEAQMCGEGPLHVYAKQGDTAAVRLLLEAGADPNLRAENDLTPLHYAVGGCDRTPWGAWAKLPVYRLLLEHGADVNARAADGVTPFHAALAKAKWYENEARKPNGWYAEKQGKEWEEVVALLRQSGGVDP